MADFDPGSLFQPSAMQMPNLPTFKKPGMFGGDGKFGIGQAIVAALNGYLASQPGGAGAVGRSNIDMMAQMAQARRQRQQELEDYNRHRSDGLADFEVKQQLEQKYAPPPQPGEYERSLIASGILPGTPEYAQHMGNRAAILENPPRYEMVNGALVQVGGPSMQSQIPQAPVGTLRPYNGGPTPPASGNFP